MENCRHVCGRSNKTPGSGSVGFLRSTPRRWTLMKVVGQKSEGNINLLKKYRYDDMGIYMGRHPPYFGYFRECCRFQEVFFSQVDM